MPKPGIFMGLCSITSQSRPPDMTENLPRSPTSLIPATGMVHARTKVVVTGSASLGLGRKGETFRVESDFFCVFPVCVHDSGRERRVITDYIEVYLKERICLLEHEGNVSKMNN